MTNISSHIASGGAYAPSRVARRAIEITLVVVVAAALTGAWLAFFTFVPFDLRIR